MVDFHTHILPNIDDGARNVTETFNMIKEARSVGFDALVSTSHYMESFYETEVSERELWVNVIRENVQEKEMGIKIYLGNEIYFTEDIIKLLEDAKASTINDTSYVLFELPLNIEPLNLYEVIHKMLKYKLVPVLAHPERYTFVHKEPNLIYDLIELGVLMQVNYGSILGMYGNNTKIIVEKLLKNNMVHFLGTDAHRHKNIYTQVPVAIDKICDIIGKEKFHELSKTNPELALRNKRINIEEATEISITLKEKIIMKFKN